MRTETGSPQSVCGVKGLRYWCDFCDTRQWWWRGGGGGGGVPEIKIVLNDCISAECTGATDVLLLRKAATCLSLCFMFWRNWFQMHKNRLLFWGGGGGGVCSRLWACLFLFSSFFLFFLPIYIYYSRFIFCIYFSLSVDVQGWVYSRVHGRDMCCPACIFHSSCMYAIQKTCLTPC